MDNKETAQKLDISEELVTTVDIKETAQKLDISEELVHALSAVTLRTDTCFVCCKPCDKACIKLCDPAFITLCSACNTKHAQPYIWGFSPL